MNMDEAELQDLLTRPLGPEELAQYQEVLESQDFKDMVRSYHADAALNSIRQVILGCFGYGISLEAMIGALANVWLDCLSDIDERLDAETLSRWRQMPQMLVQILLLQAVDTLQEREAELKTEYPVEYAEMYEQWHKQMPPAQALVPTLPEALKQHVENSLKAYHVLNDFRHKMEASDLQLDGGDYLQAWTRCLLQTFLFSEASQVETFYLIDANWALFLERLTAIVTLMVMLKGSEGLLLPELVVSPEFQRKIQNLE